MSRGRSPRWRRNQLLKCVCGGYHFPHRVSSGACDHSKTRNIHVAKRGGNPEEIADAILGHVLAHGPTQFGGGKPSNVCPF